MAGSPPGSNSMSTTGPMTCTIFPMLMPRLLRSACAACLEGFRAADDVEQLLGDLLLARLVVLDRQDVDHLLGVLGGRLHRRHASAVLAGQRLHQSAVDLHAHVARQQVAQNAARARLVDVVDVLGRASRARLRPRDWQQRYPDRTL